ncbi:MAG: hypothetical protein AMXMBFR84_40820 [Candidatus Hydrogenedentota bacterium]
MIDTRLAKVGLALAALMPAFGCIQGPVTLEPGTDAFVTQSADAKLIFLDFSSLDFSADPIPAGFFGTGSDPFSGVIPLQSLPINDANGCDDADGIADTLIRRNEPADLPNFGASSTVDIELVGLSLQSIAPIVVNYNGGTATEMWNVVLNPIPSQPSTGSMVINRDRGNGGTFSGEIDANLVVTFTRTTDQAQCVKDIFPNLVIQRGEWTYGPIISGSEKPTSCSGDFGAGLVQLPFISTLFKRTTVMKSDGLTILISPQIIIQDN